jgi:hypothetical protein
MNATSVSKDRFLVKWSLLLAALVGATLGSLRSGHTFWAAVASATSVLVALTIAGWLAAWRYFEADIVVAIRAQGGQMETRRLPDEPFREQLLHRLSRRGVITIAGDTVSLNEEKLGRLLALFIRIRKG